jgi:hypothetical protein
MGDDLRASFIEDSAGVGSDGGEANAPVIRRCRRGARWEDYQRKEEGCELKVSHSRSLIGLLSWRIRCTRMTSEFSTVRTTIKICIETIMSHVRDESLSGQAASSQISTAIR